MKRLLLFVLLGVAGLPLAAVATDPHWINIGTVTAAPQIDASNFVNEAGAVFGDPLIQPFSAHPFEPFETSNTRNFTNKGSMTSMIGFGFNTVSSGTGVRRMASSFRNHPLGTVTAMDGGPYAIIGPGNVIEAPSKLTVSATNLINEGLLTVGSQGLMNLEGKNVNLNRGRLQILPFFGRGVILVPPNFIPDVGLIDNYWNVFTNNINSQNILTVVGGNAIVASPIHPVRLPGGVVGTTSLGPFFANSFVYTNIDAPVTIMTTNEVGEPIENILSTNMTVQAAFVGVSDPSVGVNATFYPSTITTNLFSTVTVGLTTSVPNPVTGVGDILALYLMDQLASETNRNLSANLSVSPTTYRPGCYQVSRAAPFEYAFGAPPNGTVTPNMLFDPLTMSNRNVGAVQAAYSVTADTVPGRVAGVPGGSISNMPGRLTINAETLDLTKMRLRSDSWVSVKGSHLTSSSNAIVDAFLLSYDIGSTNGNLRIQNLAQRTVDRFGGVISCWSGRWTNTMRFELTNFSAVTTNILVPDPDDPTITNTITTNIYVFSPVTNNIIIGFHTLILDARTLSAQVAVYTHDLVTRSANVILNDPLFVTNSFFTDSQRFTIEGTNAQLTFGVGLQDWEVVNAPNLLYLTNSAAFSVPDQAHFGDDRPLPYAALVNKGSLSAAGISVRSDYFENRGLINANSLVSIQTLSGKVEGGTLNSGGDVRFFADVLKFNHATIVNSRFDLAVTNNLFDTGGGSGNTVTCRDGFSLRIKPASGDLLGTTIQSTAPQFTPITHTWAGADRGTNKAGFLNNAAIGRLQLIGQGIDPLCFFTGTGAANGLYVDFLDLSQLADFQNMLQIDPSLVIYFAAARLGFTPPQLDGVAQLPEEFLDGQFDGHLRWVKDFAGPNSSVDVVLNGTQTIQANKALRNSKIIDSDGDGTPNFYDFTPFDTVQPLVVTGSMMQTNQPPSKAFLVTWTAAPNTVYQVEFTTNTMLAAWQPLLKYTNSAPTDKIVTIWDTNVSAGAIPRFYRVGYGP